MRPASLPANFCGPAAYSERGRDGRTMESPAPLPPATRRQFLQGAGALGLGAHALAGRALSRRREERPLNVLWLIADQHRADVAGFAGNPHARTPALDRLAAQSARVTDVYCQIPLCAPARQSLLTGRYPHSHGIFRNFWNEQKRDDPTFAHALREAGYATALVGKSHCDTSGFDVVLDTRRLGRLFRAAEPGSTRPGRDAVDELEDDGDGPNKEESVVSMNPEYRPPAEGEQFFMEAAVADETIRLLSERGEEPFFIWASFVNPHPPLFPPKEYLDAFATAEIPIPGDMREAEPGLFAYHRQRREQWGYDQVTPGQLLSITRAYYASLAWTDCCIGRILDHLEASGAAEDTLVVYTSDHGESLGEHGLLQKRAFYEGPMRVPCLVRLPGRISPGSVHPRVAQHIDLVATVFDLLSLDAPDYFEGRSMARGLTGGGWDGWEDFAIAEMALGSTRPTRTPGVLPEKFGWMLRRGPWKFVDHGAGEVALYDLASDPHELDNLAGEPEQAARVEELRGVLQLRVPARWAYHHRHNREPQNSNGADGADER